MKISVMNIDELINKLKKIEDYYNYRIESKLFGNNIYLDIEEDVETITDILSNLIPILEDFKERLSELEKR